MTKRCGALLVAALTLGACSESQATRSVDTSRNALSDAPARETQSATAVAPPPSVAIPAPTTPATAESDSLRARLVRVADSLKSQTRVPFRAPLVVRGAGRDDQIYPTVLTARATEYEVVLGVEEDCDGGNWCRAGTVTGHTLPTSAPMPSGTRVALSGGRTGVFVEGVCGANCEDSKLIWEQDGARYSVGLKAGTEEDLRRAVEATTRLP